MRIFIFAIIALCITYLLYVYPFFLLSHLLFGTPILQIYSALLSVIIFAIVFAYFVTHISTPLIKGLTHYGMGLGFLGFCIFIPGYLISYFMPDAKFEIGLALLIIFISVAIASLIQGHKIQIKNLTFENAKLTKPVKVMFISDVHLGSNSRRLLDAICTKIVQYEFDYLLIGGDLFDSSSFKTDDLLPLRQITQPIYFVTGNHEYYVREHNKKLAALEQFNITMLDNQTVSLGEIHLIGISDNQSANTQADMARKLLDADRFNFLLVHQPSVWDDMAGEVDLMMSGHTHNGQIFPFNLLVRMQFRTVYGLFEEQQSALYVSSGSGTWGPRMRLGSQNEIVMVELCPSE